MNENEGLLRWQTRMAVGRMAYGAGYYAQAIRHFRLALTLVESNGLADTLRARSQTGLAKSLAALGRYAEAEPLILEALKIDEANPDALAGCAEDYHQLGLLCWRSGRDSESLNYALKAMELAKRAGADAPDELRAKLLKHLAVLSEQAGNAAQTEHYLNQAIDFITCSNQLGKNSMIYGDVLLVKVLFLAEQGRYEEAAELYPQAMQLVSMMRGLDHPRVEEAINIFKDLEQPSTILNAAQTEKMESLKEFEPSRNCLANSFALYKRKSKSYLFTSRSRDAEGNLGAQRNFYFTSAFGQSKTTPYTVPCSDNLLD